MEKPEQPTSNQAIVGIYYFKDSIGLKAALDRLVTENRSARGEFQLTDAFTIMIKNGIKIKPYPVDRWLDCGTIDALLDTNRYLLRALNLTSPVGVHNSTVIPPVFIANSSRIAFSTIGPYASVGEDTEIENSTVRDSIVDSGARINNALVEKSFVGKNERVEGK